MSLKIKDPICLIRARVQSRTIKGLIHTVEIYSSGDSRCSCPAGEMGKFCYHQRKVYQMTQQALKELCSKHQLKTQDSSAEDKVS